MLTQCASHRSRKPAVKQNEISAILRRRIVSGELPPGTRLPTRKELEVEFGVSLHTVQRALDRLSDEGFVIAKGSQGTVVADAPPHLSRYGLVIAYDVAEEGMPRYFAALANEARRLGHQGPSRYETYYGVKSQEEAAEHQRLLSDVREHRLAGLIFPAIPHPLIGMSLMNEPNMPRVAIASHGAPDGMAMVMLRGIFDRGLDYLVSRGRRSVALLGAAPRHVDEFAVAARARGLQVQPHWMQCVNAVTPSFARAVMHLLMHGGHAQRPDALLIADDNLVEHAVGGLVDAGARVPDEVEVVAHCNFPWPTPSPLPIRRLGYDTRAMLRACVDQIDAHRRTGTVPAPVTIEPMFEDEIQ